MTGEELLLELKDLAPPAEPGWWLLAPGYLVLLMLLIGLATILWLWWLRRKAARLFVLANLELQRIRSTHVTGGDSRRLSLALSRWLKQVALLAFPERGLEALTGSDWLSFLDQTIGDTSFTRGAGKVFGDAIYRRQAGIDAERLLVLCEQWLSAVKPRLIERGSR